MKQARKWKLRKGIGVLSIVGLIFMFGNPTAVEAQAGRGGPQLELEKARAAWTLAAQGVAKELGLNNKATSQLIDAYTAARGSHRKALEGLSGGREGFQASRELTDKERDKLETVLKGFLSDEQAGKALASLGAFSGEWDRMLDVLAGFKLGDEPLYKALPLISTYVIDYDQARSKAIANQDWQSMRSARQGLKEKLDAGLAEIFSQEQLATWKEATAPRRRG